ncbi:MAG: T9SS type A sorting domain-containing protein, partial [Candidatus Kapaibacterium sp.]
TFSEQQLYMYDLAYDKDDKVLWVTDFNSGDSKIYKIDPDNGSLLGSINVSGGRDFTGIKYDPDTKHLFVHQSNQSTNTSSIYEIDVTGKIIHKFSSPCAYGTGIFVIGDSLFLADRNNNIIHVVSKQDPTTGYNDLPLNRKALFGPRCITLDPKTGNLLHTWTDFQGSDPAGSDASLYDSYILHLNRNDGTELGSSFVQDGTNSGTNVRGIELDPRFAGTQVWVTVLNSGNSSKILKLTLVDGPTNGVANVSNKAAAFKANYPNPFSEYTTLPYSLDKEANVKLIVRDVLGREVYTTPSQYQSAGEHRITLHLESLPSGRYICELSVNNIRTDIQSLIKD